MTFAVRPERNAFRVPPLPWYRRRGGDDDFLSGFNEAKPRAMEALDYGSFRCPRIHRVYVYVYVYFHSMFFDGIFDLGAIG